MLYELLNANRDAIVQRVRERAGVSAAADADLGAGVATFVSQLSDLLFLRHADAAASTFERRAEMGKAAAEHGGVLLRHGFTLVQVVQSYMAIGRALVDIATDRGVQLSHHDFVTIDLSIEAAVSGTVAEHVARGHVPKPPASVRPDVTGAEWKRGAAGNQGQTQSR